MIIPSNSVPLPVLIVVGEKAFHMIDSQILVAINRDIPYIINDNDDNDIYDDNDDVIPEPNPYPFCNNSSRVMTTIPAANNCKIIRIALPAPIV